MNTDFKPSQYQKDIFDFVQNGTGNGIIDAKAGSGKTSTIVKALEYIPNTASVLFVAFNKSIAMELKERAPKNVKACTLNSFGYSLCMAHIKKYIKIDPDKTRTLLRFNILQVKKGDKEAETYLYTIQHAVKRIVSLLKANYICKPQVKDVTDMMEAYDVSVKLKEDKLPMFYDHVIATFTLCVNTFNVMDFDDQIFLPVFHGWKFPKFDFVFIDEAQDLNKSQLELILKLA